MLKKQGHWSGWGPKDWHHTVPPGRALCLFCTLCPCPLPAPVPPWLVTPCLTPRRRVCEVLGNKWLIHPPEEKINPYLPPPPPPPHAWNPWLPQSCLVRPYTALGGSCLEMAVHCLVPPGFPPRSSKPPVGHPLSPCPWSERVLGTY